MNNIIPFPSSRTRNRHGQPTTEPDYFGDCPHCGTTTGYFNIGREQYCYCATHQTKWDIGSNVLSTWREETEEVWQRNRYRFGAYRLVQPLHRDAGLPVVTE